MTEKGKIESVMADLDIEDSASACVREDGKIHAVVFKLVAESNVIAKGTPTLWSLVDVMLIEQEEFATLPKYLEDKFGPGLYHLYQGHFDKIHIQDINQMKIRTEKDIGTIEEVERERATELKLREEIAEESSHGFD